MSVTRVPSMLEQSIITMQGGLAPQVRSNLSCASNADVSAANAQIVSVSAVNNMQITQIAALSAADVLIRADVAAVSAGLATAGIPRSEVAAISAAQAIDIENVGTELGYLQLSAITWSGTAAPATGSPTAWFNVSISGASYKIGLY